MISLIAWRTTGKNPCDDPPVTIIIATRGKLAQTSDLWLFSLERAVEVFGQGVVDQIGEKPVIVNLYLTIPVTNLKLAEPASESPGAIPPESPPL